MSIKKTLDCVSKALTPNSLEWPVVVATGLEERVWSRLWDVSVVTDRSEIDLENPLADRFIRYWLGLSGSIPRGFHWSTGSMHRKQRRLAKPLTLQSTSGFCTSV